MVRLWMLLSNIRLPRYHGFIRQVADSKLQTEHDACGEDRRRMPFNRRSHRAEEQAHIKAQHRQNTTEGFGRFLVDW